MADYLRLVSYIYAYENGVKTKNVGFAKIDSRNNSLRIIVNLKLPKKEFTMHKIHFFIRQDKELIGVFLGSGTSDNGEYEFRLMTKDSDIVNSGRSINEIKGIFINPGKDSSVFYASVWDDQDVDWSACKKFDTQTKVQGSFPENDETKAYNSNEESHTRVSETIEESGTIDKFESNKGLEANEESETNKGPDANKESEANEESETNKEVEVNREPETDKEPEVNRENKSNRETEVNLESETIEEVNSKQSSTAGYRNQWSGNIHEIRQRGTGRDGRPVINPEYGRTQVNESEPERNMRKEIKREENEVVENENNVVKIESVMCEERQSESFQNICPDGMDTEELSDRQNEREPKEAITIWERMLGVYPKILCVGQLADKECIKIKPQDLAYFPKKYWSLGNNSFLLHGYYNYKYLLTIRDKEGRFFIGVPGTYHNKEKMTASMFGFSEFMMEKTITMNRLSFGYWIMSIDLE